MGKIVASMATMHAPELFTRPPEEDPKQLDAGIAAMKKLGETLDETRPDALIIFASDHLETFFLRSVPTFAIVAGERAVASFAGRRWAPRIHQDLAENLLDQLVRGGFDMVYSQDAELGHSFAAPFEWVLGERDIPVVPVFVNTYLPPLPSPRRCAALGEKIAEIVGGRPERVVMLASGGMSHYPGTWKYYQPAFGFDRWCIDQLESGHSDSFLDLTVEQLDEVGNTEMLPWAPILGAIGPQHMELLSYQETSHHGHAVARFHPGLPKEQGAKLPYHFENHPFCFYEHPTVNSYNLNKLLYESRSRTQMRIKLLSDPRAVAHEYNLGEEETATLAGVVRLPYRNSKQPAKDAEPLVKMGAHPLGALMAVHVLQAELRRLERSETRRSVLTYE